jgi:hypothetical protein
VLACATVLIASFFAVHAYAATRKPSFSLSASTSPLSVAPGGTKQYTIKLKRTRRFRGTVTLKVTKLPRGATARWTLPNGRKLPRPRRSTGGLLKGNGKRALLTVRTTGATPVGTFKPVITATSGRIRRARKVALAVRPPAQQSVTVVATPVGRDLLQGDSTAFDVSIVRGGGFTGAVELTVSGLPEGVGAAFAPAAVIDGSTATLTLEASPSAPVGSHTLTIVASNGVVSGAMPVTLNVKETKAFTITGDVDAPLSPGARQPLDATVTNPYDFDLSVASIAARVAGTDQPGCGPQNFYVTQVAPARLPLTLRPGTTSLTGLGLAQYELPQVEMLNLSSNQDACQGARIALDFSGRASR